MTNYVCMYGMLLRKTKLLLLFSSTLYIALKNFTQREIAGDRERERTALQGINELQ